MLATPSTFCLTAGKGEARTKLTAFDKALLEAGLGNLNIIRVSSVLPPGCRQVEKLTVAPGSLVPTAYGCVISDVPGERLSAAVAVGLSLKDFGMIMEYAGDCSRKEAEEIVQGMVEEAFDMRGMRLHHVLVKGVEHWVERVGAVIAAVAMGY